MIAISIIVIVVVIVVVVIGLGWSPGIRGELMAGTQVAYEGVVRHCRGKIRRAKAQLDLAPAGKDDKSCSCRSSSSRRRAQENLPPWVDVEHTNKGGS